jgi:hypothetical protein
LTYHPPVFVWQHAVLKTTGILAAGSQASPVVFENGSFFLFPGIKLA